MRTQIFLTLSLLLIASTSAAITDIDSLRMSAPEGKTFIGEGGLSASGTGGNSETTTLSATNNMLWLRQLNEYMILFNYKYGESFKVKNANEGFLHFRYTRTIHNIADQWESYIQGDTNEFRSLKERSLVGSNLRWKLRDEENSKISFGLGAFLYRERLDVIDPDFKEDSGLRLNTHLIYTVKLAEAAALSVGVYYQPKVNSWNDAQSLANLNIESPISNGFSTELDFSYRYDSTPPPDIKNYDLSYTAGVKYTY